MQGYVPFLQVMPDDAVWIHNIFHLHSKDKFHRISSSIHTFSISHLYMIWVRNNISVRLVFFQIFSPTNTPHSCHRHMPQRLQNTQELAPLFIRWVTSAYPAVLRKVSTVCYDDHLNHWAKDTHIKDRWKVWCHMASLGWKGLKNHIISMIWMLTWVKSIHST
jgi:hypothetical protein